MNLYRSSSPTSLQWTETSTNLLILLLMSLIKLLKSIGASTDHRGTPVLTDLHPDTESIPSLPGCDLATSSSSTEQSIHQICICPIYWEGCYGETCQRPCWRPDNWESPHQLSVMATVSWFSSSRASWLPTPPACFLSYIHCCRGTSVGQLVLLPS